MTEQPIKIDTDLLTYIKRGVLWVNKKPYYIVELIKEGNVSYVMVYNVQPGTEDNPQKAAIEVTSPTNRFSTQTVLGQLANMMFPAKVTRKWVPKDPAFVAPVIPNQVNTFTKKIESGFFEREEDRVVVHAGEKKLARGKNTGVFIGLSSVTWEDKLKIPTEALVKALRRHQAESLFFDLSGNNNGQSNPLATYYKGGDISE